eukprot:6187858-Pleurochrysis_carterae.AAC.2
MIGGRQGAGSANRLTIKPSQSTLRLSSSHKPTLSILPCISSALPGDSTAFPTFRQPGAFFNPRPFSSRAPRLVKYA